MPAMAVCQSRRGHPRTLPPVCTSDRAPALSGVTYRAAGVYKYLLPRHVPSSERETLRHPWNDPLGVTLSARIVGVRPSKARAGSNHG